MLVDQNLENELRLVPPARRRLVQQKRPVLVDNISDVGKLLDELRSKLSFSRRHCEAVKSNITRSLKIGNMLDILERRSFLHFNQFLDALRDCRQSHVADIIDSNASKTF